MQKEKILVLFAHPLLERSRANKVLINAYKNIDNITFHDLYEKYPEFNINVKQEKELLLAHSLVIWHHPFYWYSCPPLLKQWIDMVLEVGWAYGPGGTALQEKHILQVITTGGGEQAYQETGSNRFSIREFLRPFEQTAYLCKMNYLPPFVVQGTHRLIEEDLEQKTKYLRAFLENWKDHLPNLSNLEYLNVYANSIGEEGR